MKSVQAILFGTVNMHDLRCFGCDAQVHEPFRITSADLTGLPLTGLAVFCKQCLPGDELAPEIPVDKTAILTHPDEVSGITVFAGGIRAYWTEGRSSEIVVKQPSGRWVIFTPAMDMNRSERKIWRTMQFIEENGADINRPMTPEEIKEWEDARR